MKRSTFFKSLLGLAVAPAAAKWVGKAEMQKEFDDKRLEEKRIRETKRHIESVQKKGVIQSVWCGFTIDEDKMENYHTKEEWKNIIARKGLNIK